MSEAGGPPDHPTPSTATSAHGAPEVSASYKWLTLGIVLIGTLLVALDSTIVNVALHTIQRDLNAGSGIEWVVTAYLLAVALSLPATGWLADHYGRRTIFLASLCAFTIASLCSALAPNLGVLIAFRVLQGLGGGAMMPVGMAMVFEVFPPEERGRAMGIWGVSSMAAPAVGPVVGGVIVDSVSWHWLFFVNVPLGVLGFVLGIRTLRDSGYRAHKPFDAIGLLLGGGGLSLSLLGLSEGNAWGWTSFGTLGSLITGVVLSAAFGYRCAHHDHPIIELDMYKHRVFARGMAVISLLVTAQFARSVFIPLELQTIRGYSATKVGFALAPAAFGTMLTMPLSGRLVDRIGARIPAIIGGLLICAGMAVQTTISTQTSLAVIVAGMAVQGTGMGFAMVPVTVVALNALPARYTAQASAMRSIVTQSSAAIAVAVLSTVIAVRTGDNTSTEHVQSAFDTAFFIGAAAGFVALVLSIGFPRDRHTLAAREAAGTHTSAAALAE